ncbi:glutaredoxin family protein [Glutamicibacter protophormiae]|uniref:glutaredoxin family protein n=1 Tax=Glutamicibacter protophormiae TaxID=37930 RepID=UPI0027E51A22|nr:glutaredoxin family protein [Glutamicibacter protophormiae]WPR63783.1 glutaredoxin family protein [Glutamicibacter protophormiae]WPR67278.1 glutaredoxin family protein [Glutamicibacter protophormiae]
MSTLHEIQLLVRQGCHLCEAARATVSKVTNRLGMQFTELDIDSDPELLERHHEEVPVLVIDGQVRDFWTIDPVRLERLLSS